MAAVVALKHVAPLVISHGNIAVRAFELIAAASAVKVITVAAPVQKQNHLLSLSQGPRHFFLKKRSEDSAFLAHVGNLNLGH